MRRWAIALLICGCTAPSPGPGRYSCSRDAGEEALGAEQCPENYRCGLENYCHRLGDVGTAWRCETDDDCENGYHCGLDAARQVRQCQDSEKPGPFACFVDADCVPPWRCGVDGVCHARGVAAEYACRADGGAPDDQWCELGWRCSTDGTCTDPAADALRPYTPAPFPSGDVAGLAPAVGPIDRFSVSQVFASGLGAGTQLVAIVEGGKLIVHLVDRRGEQPPMRYDLGPAPATFAAHGSRGASGTPLAITDSVPRVLTANAQGDLSIIALAPDGGFSETTAGPGARRFSQGTAAVGLAPRTIAWQPTPTSFVAVSGAEDLWNGGYDVAIGVAFGAVPGNAVLDIVGVRAKPDREAVYAVDQRGVWLLDRAVGGSDCFLPLVVPPLSNPHCAGAPAAHRPTRLSALGINDLAVAAEAPDGGGETLTVLDTSQVWAGDHTCFAASNPCGADRVPVSIALGPCRACPAGGLIEFSLLEGGARPRVELACGEADGGAIDHYVLTAGTGAVPTCTRALVAGEPALFSAGTLLRPEQRAIGQVAWSDGARHAWAGPTAATALSLTLDRAPQVVVLRDGALGPFAMTQQMTARPEPGFGLFEEPGVGAIAGVAGKPAWAVLKDGQVVDLSTAQRAAEGRLVGKVGPVALELPSTAAEVPVATGKRALVVTSGFTLLAGEVDPAAVATVAPRHTSRAQLRSISFPRPATGAYVEGFAVSGGNVVRLIAAGLSQWSEATVALPPTLSPLEVWHDLERGRVGFTDGTVMSLPSRVPLAPPIGDEVLDYAQACGHQLALTRTALYRLESVGGQTVGRWVKQPLPDGFGADGFLGGRAFGLGEALFVFTRGGAVARWQFTACP